MPHITPDGKRLVLTVEDLNENGPFSIELPDSSWLELSVKHNDVVLDLGATEDFYEEEVNIFIFPDAAIDNSRIDQLEELEQEND